MWLAGLAGGGLVRCVVFIGHWALSFIINKVLIDRLIATDMYGMYCSSGSERER